ncbi:D-2-hydroxyacid dehydrogenase [Trebonia kvetii]|uniref:D-2-hydroxyacid dehydrogenase n=1 Tax=Trebonia kvetii TaxID=2480626 RepID=A0A6P2C7G0_9ACTN|nr:D-2-hydroxyacid dehydrogenase [Trebonia kvetii]TVZ05981.1 D-2-hydroxyacid dehydrogenase [Trebonia kvetii]
MTDNNLTIVIGSYLEPELVDRIRAARPAASVVYEPGLLPAPRYQCDHTGPARNLSPNDVARWRELTARADVFFDFDWLDPAEMANHSKGLRWIQATSAGIGGFMQRTGLDKSGLTVTTAGGIHSVPLAEFALTGALYFTKGIPELRQRQQARHWERYTTRQLAGQRALVVGLGGMGRQVVATFAALGVAVTGLGRDGGRYDVPGLSRLIYRDELDAALTDTDILILCCPLTPETEGLIGRAQLDRLPPHAVLVNIARGQVVDQDALIDALANGRLGGACLDVFTKEPLPADSPLWGMDNVLVSPHSASTVATENERLTDLFLDNLKRFQAGQSLRNLYQSSRGY